ncbi:polyribonucleotide nucleotidyltransferase [Candidatus Aerophobetes bacterium]|uniref:Polyribonucleotide nucleotidyltransferase n=1 Tax=Aerophobetes bacterium TaxID=2030807 RepID=A0A523YQ01_UNCAE|nr:MAG: polyribonucleotide nucleotidyltransferase [Candidatus Aerophobetes bacterium]
MEKNNITRIEKKLEERLLILETGKIAKKSGGAVLVQYEDTIVLVTVVISPTVQEDMGFAPLIVDYREKAYAVGKIPGGFFKREGRPSDAEILASRLIDRSIRPFFPQGFRNEVQVIASVLSASESNQPAILSVIGASLALSVADFPCVQLIGGVRVGRIKGQLVINPRDDQLKESELNLVVVGNKEGLIMVEGDADRVSEEVVLEAFQVAHSFIKRIIEIEEEFISQAKKEKKEFPLYQIEEEIRRKVTDFAEDKIKAIGSDWTEDQKDSHFEKVKEEVLDKFLSDYPEKEKDFLDILGELKKKKIRELIIEEGKRWDLRGIDEVRPISCEVGILPRVHGSGLFSRGDTQSLVVATLGTASDEQIIDGLHKGEISKTFMFHYNFLPFSTGETRFLRGPGRREIGHGLLAERALLPVLPDEKSFPYTIRLVSDILESNGSSSMASVCGGSLSLMDAGVPVSDPIAGVGMGLIKEGDKVVILTDIQGLEDHFGDMDFKIAGTEGAITALQLDIKVSGVSLKVMEEALDKAKVARGLILKEMEKIIDKPRSELSDYAPRIVTLSIPLDKIGDIIGPGGKIIKGIIKETGAEIDIDDLEGKVTISSPDEDGANKALMMIKDLIRDPKVGEVYLGKVKRVTDFGAFVEIMPRKEGLVHISQLSDKFVKNVSDVVKVGDEISVKLIGIDEMGRLNLSKKGIEEGTS